MSIIGLNRAATYHAINNGTGLYTENRNPDLDLSAEIEAFKLKYSDAKLYPSIAALINYFEVNNLQISVVGAHDLAVENGGGSFFTSPRDGITKYIIWSPLITLKWEKQVVDIYTYGTDTKTGRKAGVMQTWRECKLVKSGSGSVETIDVSNLISLIHELGHARQDHEFHDAFTLGNAPGIGGNLSDAYLVREGYNIRDTEWPACHELGLIYRRSLKPLTQVLTGVYAGLLPEPPNYNVRPWVAPVAYYSTDNPADHVPRTVQAIASSGPIHSMPSPSTRHRFETSLR